MSHESTLNHIHSTINQKLADVESRIERVKTAKKEIEKEHETGIVEIRQILHPHLNSHWTGDFANDFDDERDEAASTNPLETKVVIAALRSTLPEVS